MVTEKISNLLDQYFDLAFAEGKEGRTHDTEAGDAQRARSELEAALSTDAEPVAHPQFEARMRDAIRFTVRETLGFVNAEIVNELFNNITAVINHCAPPQPAPSVAVKALEWVEGTFTSTDDDNGPLEGIPTKLKAWRAGPYTIIRQRHKNGLFILKGRCAGVGLCVPRLEQAKAAAQSDYEARIRSALSAQAQDVAGDRPMKVVKHLVEWWDTTDVRHVVGGAPWCVFEAKRILSAAPAAKLEEKP